MVIYKNDKVQRGHNFAIVDEVDSILIDEARTPLIISGPGEKSTDLYVKSRPFCKNTEYGKGCGIKPKRRQRRIIFRSRLLVDEKAKTATLTPSGVKKQKNILKLKTCLIQKILHCSTILTRLSKRTVLCKKISTT